jgi:hypothetical protein
MNALDATRAGFMPTPIRDALDTAGLAVADIASVLTFFPAELLPEVSVHLRGDLGMAARLREALSVHLPDATHGDNKVTEHGASLHAIAGGVEWLFFYQPPAALSEVA